MNRPDCKYICDCCDIRGEFRCLCLENDLATLMRDFKEWVVENHFTPAAICYAHIVDNSRKKLRHIGNFILKEDGSVELVTVAPKKRKRKQRVIKNLETVEISRFLVRQRGFEPPAY